MSQAENLKLFYDKLAELYKLGCISSLLGWDQRVYMPTESAKARAEQQEYMDILMHQKNTDPEFARVVDELYAGMDSLPTIEDKVNVRETKRNLDIARKLPEAFVAEMSQAASMAYSCWVEARPKNDFKAIQPHLEKIVELNKREAELLGYDDNPYDALLDLYDPGSKTSVTKPLLLGLAEELRKIIPDIAAKFADVEPLNGHYPEAVQYKFARRIAENLGFGFDSGRIDTTAHPFMTSMGPSDVRITTRYDETDPISSLYSIIHETGHALYDLGLPKQWAGTPMGESVSLSVHESQSRMWENLVGRSKEFCVYLSGVTKEFFPEEPRVHELESLWKLVNKVKPSFIRTEADEVTYSQHVVIRMLIEEALMNNELKVADLPGAWGDMYEKYLGVRPSDDKDGVMQDVHWYQGAIGYFPTYALGNLYNSMMMETAKAAIPDLYKKFETGDFSVLLSWLRENVHKHGMHYRGPELIKKITGKDLSADAFVNYLKAKFLA